jgi:hypothetical protein
LGCREDNAGYLDISKVSSILRGNYTYNLERGFLRTGLIVCRLPSRPPVAFSRKTLYTLPLSCNSYTSKEISMNLSVGQTAPDFTLKDHLERNICLNDYRGQRNVVIAFFPLAWTPV